MKRLTIGLGPSCSHTASQSAKFASPTGVSTTSAGASIGASSSRRAGVDVAEPVEHEAALSGAGPDRVVGIGTELDLRLAIVRPEEVDDEVDIGATRGLRDAEGKRSIDEHSGPHVHDGSTRVLDDSRVALGFQSDERPPDCGRLPGEERLHSGDERAIRPAPGRSLAAMIPLMSEPANRYTHGHHESVLRSHRWRTAENSAAYLLDSLAPGLDLLDVGCGPGNITIDLATP